MSAVMESEKIAWSPEQEAATIMKLAAAQTGLSLTQASASVNTLTANFSEMVKAIHAIKLEAQEASPNAHAMILTHCEEFLNRVQASLVGFQFYDRMHQRLEHIARHLENALDVAGDRNAVRDPKAWQSLRDKIKASYNIEEDRVLFDEVLRGTPVKDAVKSAAKHAQTTQQGKAELF